MKTTQYIPDEINEIASNAIAIARKRKKMVILCPAPAAPTVDHLRAIIRGYGLTRAWLANFCGVSATAVDQWLAADGSKRMSRMNGRLFQSVVDHCVKICNEEANNP